MLNAGVSVTDPPASGGTLMHEASPSVDAHARDAESREWLEALSGTGRRREDATARLYGLLLRASRFEIARRRRAAGSGHTAELDDLATQAADDALMAIMRKLHTYRGDSRFTTWAYKFALLEAAVKTRRRAWQAREVPLEEAGWAQLRDQRAAPDTDAETAELIGAVGRAIAEALTPHQRAVLIAITLNDVPIDVLAERLNTTRGALYKTLHDGRRKLRARLAADGHALDAAGEETR
jgi:RNA polymerase sigma-70 factor (ECF subfamily)